MSSPKSLREAALITGGGSGIGAATARALSERGYFVYLLGRNRKNLEAVAAELPHAAVVVADLSKAKDLEKRLSVLAKNLKYPLTVLVNNAGIFERHSVRDGSDDLWLRQFDVNMMGSVRVARFFWSMWKKQKKASIVNVSSTLGLRPTADTAAYSATKAAMVNWTQSLALNGGAHGIRVNCVCPGLVDTPIHAFHSLPKKEKAAALRKMASLQPLGRVGTPEDIAASIAFLASDESAWTTGAVLCVDGGIQLA